MRTRLRQRRRVTGRRDRGAERGKLNFPTGVDSVTELRKLIAWSQAQHVDYELADDNGDGISIGVVDTLYRPPEPMRNVVEERLFCLPFHRGERPDRTAEHGAMVLDIARQYAPSAAFYPILAAKETETDDGGTRVRFPHAAFGDAVQAAIDHDIDVLNVSAGRAKPDCTHGSCSYCTDAKRASEAGITVVASAGNRSDEPVHCPSNETAVISVGGVEFECRFTGRTRHPTPKPPLAYWTRLWENYDDYPDTAADGAYCTGRGCAEDRGSCDDCKRVRPWDRNPIASGEKPDVLAPLHYAAERTDGYPFVWAGSSFAAPLVAGCLSGILGEVPDTPAPFTVRQAIRDSSVPIHGADTASFDAARTRERLVGEPADA